MRRPKREKGCNGLRALSRAASGRREPETRVEPNKGSWGSGSARVGEGIRFGYYPPPRRDPSPSFPPRHPLSQDNAALLAVTQYHSTCIRPSLYFGPCRLSPALLTPACSPVPPTPAAHRPLSQTTTMTAIVSPKPRRADFSHQNSQDRPVPLLSPPIYLSTDLPRVCRSLPLASCCPPSDRVLPVDRDVQPT